MPNHRYQPHQILFLRQNYARLTLAQLAAALGVSGETAPRKVLDLARRHGLRKRAFNGAPQWRG